MGVVRMIVRVEDGVDVRHVLLDELQAKLRRRIDQERAVTVVDQC